jgi:DNA-binding XRE family transcriptional regulator
MTLTPEQLKKLRRSPGQNRIKVARELMGLTQIELAPKVGVSQSALSDLERRRYSGTSVDTARRFAEIFGCLIEDLFPPKSEVA